MAVKRTRRSVPYLQRAAGRCEAAYGGGKGITSEPARGKAFFARVTLPVKLCVKSASAPLYIKGRIGVVPRSKPSPFYGGGVIFESK